MDWAHEFDAMRNRIAALEAQLAEREWRPIETAPKDGNWVLISGGTYGCEFSPCEFYGARFDRVGMAVWDAGNKQWENGEMHYHPTHWQPMPPPPKEAP
jgi:hypothetical protein